MAPNFTTEASDSASFVTLYHGTGDESIKHILKFGLSEERALAGEGEGKFWCTTSLRSAAIFAAGTLDKPMILRMEIADSLIQEFLAKLPPWLCILGHRYRFEPPGFETLTSSMTKVVVLDARTVPLD